MRREEDQFCLSTEPGSTVNLLVQKARGAFVGTIKNSVMALGKVAFTGLIAIVLSACNTKQELPSFGVTVPELKSPPPGMVVIAPGAQLVGVPSQWNPALIHQEDFFPPGDFEKLESEKAYPRQISRMPSARFPSAQLCLSPLGRYELSCIERREGELQWHILVLEDSLVKKSSEIWKSSQSFEVVWSQGGYHVAITHWLADELSEVLVYSVVRNAVYALPEVFPGELAGILPQPPRRGYWMFRAIGWAPGIGEQLVVRGIGHDPRFPRQDYGCEFTIDFY